MKNKINKNEKELVLARVSTFSEDTELSIGCDKSYSKDEIFKNVSDETDIGKQIIDVEMNFLRELVSGDLHKLMN